MIHFPFQRKERPLQTAWKLDHAATQLMLQDSTVLLAELIPAVAYQITPFPFNFHQYHTQADMDLVHGMTFTFEVFFSFYLFIYFLFLYIMHSALIENFFSGMNSIQLLSMHRLPC